MTIKTLTFCAGILLSTAATAEITATAPANGAMVMTHTSEITLSFSEPEKLLNVRVTRSDGTPLDISYQEDSAEKHAIPTGKLKPDTYKVSWVAEKQDGSTEKGSFGFMQH